MKSLKETSKKHLVIFLCSILFIFIIVHLFCGFEYIYIFSTHPSDWYNLFLALFFALAIYLFIDSQTSSKLDDIKQIESNIEKNTNEMKSQIKNVSKITEDTQKNVNKTSFLVERTTAINKYPETEKFKKINEAYQPFIFSLFDEVPSNIISIEIEKQKELKYEIKTIKNDNDIPITDKSIFHKFYIIEIINPAYANSISDDKLKEYENSPIKEGEYYGCRFDENLCSWVLNQRLSGGSGFYKFRWCGTPVRESRVYIANQFMGRKGNYPIDEYEGKGSYDFNGNILSLFQREKELLYTIGDSPLKKIYKLKTNSDSSETFLVFEHLRGYINRDSSLIKELKNIVCRVIDLDKLPALEEDICFDEKNHHITISL